MKDGAQEILGKTISGVVLKSSERSPCTQLFLIFTDGTYFEFYSHDGKISPTGGADPGTIEDVRQYMRAITETVYEAIPQLGF